MSISYGKTSLLGQGTRSGDSQERGSGLEEGIGKLDSGSAQSARDSINSTDLRIQSSQKLENKELAALGLRDTSPEILMISNFLTAYTKEHSVKKNSNFDFMLFQTQLDLTVKEIINKKIESDENLKNQILENYKVVLSGFFENKDLLESLYLKVVNLFESFSITENLKTFIKTTTLTAAPSEDSEPVTVTDSGVELSVGLAPQFGTGVTLGSQSDFINDISRRASLYGYSFTEDTVSSFLINNSIGRDSVGYGDFVNNKLFRLCAEFINKSIFGFPNPGFKSLFEDKTAMLSDVDANEDLKLESLKPYFPSQLAVVSRSKRISNNAELREKLQDINRIVEIRDFTTSLQWENLGDLLIGSTSVYETGGYRFSSKSTLLTGDATDVQVFNSSVVPDETKFQASQNLSVNDKMTGKEYFARNILSNLENELTDLDLTKLTDEISSQTSSILELLNFFGLEYSNTFIKDVAAAAYDAFGIKNLFINDSTVKNENLETYGGLQALSALANREIEFSRGPNDSSVQIFSIYSENEDIPTTNIDTGFRRYIARWRSDTGTVTGYSLDLLNSDVNQSTFNSIKSEYIQFQFNTIPTNSRGPGVAFENFFKEIDRMYEDNSYVSIEKVRNMAIRVLYYIFKDFNLKSYKGSSKRYVLLSKSAFKSLFTIRDIVSDGVFDPALKSREKAIGKDEPEDNEVTDRIKKLYRDVSYPFFASTNILLGIRQYMSKIKSGILETSTSLAKVNDIFETESFGLNTIGLPSLEKITNLNIGYKHVYSPTTSFSPNPSYFTYHNTRTSNDIVAINTFQLQNFKDVSFDPSYEGKRFAVIGIPDGLINSLRIDSGRSNDHAIIEISLLALDHKYGNDGDTPKFTCRYKYIFNSALHVNSVNPDINLRSALNLFESKEYSDILNVDDREVFEGLDFNEQDLLSFNFGKIKNKQFLLETKKKIDDAISYNLGYKIDSNDYIFNGAMSGKIIKNHITSYTLKRHLEIFGGFNINENTFSYFPNSRLRKVNDSAQELINYFDQQQYTDDLKDYLKRSVITSPVISPESFLTKAYSLTKFERVFIVPCFDSMKMTNTNENIHEEDHFAFKSLIPVVRIL